MIVNQTQMTVLKKNDKVFFNIYTSTESYLKNSLIDSENKIFTLDPQVFETRNSLAFTNIKKIDILSSDLTDSDLKTALIGLSRLSTAQITKLFLFNDKLNIKFLEYCLHLNAIKFIDSSPDYIKNCIDALVNKDKITKLQLQFCHETPELLKYIFDQLKSLNSISIQPNANSFSENTPQVIAKREQIKSISFKAVTPYFTQLSVIPFNNLVSLNLKGQNAMTDSSVITMIENCPDLKRLNLESCPISDDFIKILVRKKKNIESLNLIDTNITTNSLRKIGKHCHQLQVFKSSIKFFSNDNPSSMALIIKNSPHLKSIDLIRMLINEVFSKTLAGGAAKHLSKIKLEFCSINTDSLIQNIFEYCPISSLELYQLDFRVKQRAPKKIAPTLNQLACSQIKADLLMEMITHSPLLTSFKLRNSENFTDSLFQKMLLSCRGIESINLDRLNITDLSLSFIENYPAFKHIAFFFCENISYQSVNSLKTKRPQMIVRKIG